MSRKPRVLAALVLACASCGGKLALPDAEPSGDDPRGSPVETDPAPSPSFSPSPAPPGDPNVSVLDACRVFCENNARCGKHTVDCVEECVSRAGDDCGARAWISCAGADATAETCQLPPRCEHAYCAWARCAGRALPDYCP